MMRMTIAVGMAALLAGCGGSPSTTTSSSSSDNSSASASTGSVTAIAGGVEGSNNCGKNPDFAPVYAGGTIRVCSSAHFDATAKTSGTVSYTTSAAPAAVLAWSKEQAEKSGLAVRMSNDKMVSASEGTRRLLMVMALPEGPGSRVTVNWTKAD